MKKRIDGTPITLFGANLSRSASSVDFLAHSGIRGEDEPFRTRANGKKYFVLTARKVCDQITGICAKHLLSVRFSCYSLCKGAIYD